MAIICSSNKSSFTGLVTVSGEMLQPAPVLQKLKTPKRVNATAKHLSTAATDRSREKKTYGTLGSVFVTYIQNACTKSVKSLKKQKKMFTVSGMTNVSRGSRNFPRELRNSRDENVNNRHWINATLAMFRPLPWPSLTEVSCAFHEKTDFRS